MVDIHKLRGLGKDTIINMINNPPELTAGSTEADLFIELMTAYIRYCHQPSCVFTYEERVSSPIHHAAGFIEYLFS